MALVPKAMQYSLRTLLVAMLLVAIASIVSVAVFQANKKNKLEQSKSVEVRRYWKPVSAYVEVERGELTRITLAVSLEKLTRKRLCRLCELKTLERIALARSQDDRSIDLISSLQSKCKIIVPEAMSDVAEESLKTYLPDCDILRRRTIRQWKQKGVGSEDSSDDSSNKNTIQDE